MEKKIYWKREDLSSFPFMDMGGVSHSVDSVCDDFRWLLQKVKKDEYVTIEIHEGKES